MNFITKDGLWSEYGEELILTEEQIKMLEDEFIKLGDNLGLPKEEVNAIVAALKWNK